MSKLIRFYQCGSPDSEGRMLEDMWRWSDERLEVCHNYVQWWFPTLTPSMFNEDAPGLSEEDMVLFRKDSILSSNLETSFHRFLAFLGLTLEDGQVKSNNDPRKAYIWSSFNHNHLRITRVLESLRLLGKKGLAESLLGYLESNVSISHNAMSHWKGTRHWDQVLNDQEG